MILFLYKFLKNIQMKKRLLYFWLFLFLLLSTHNYFQSITHEYWHYIVWNYVIGYKWSVEISKNNTSWESFIVWNGWYYHYNLKYCKNEFKIDNKCRIPYFYNQLLNVSWVIWQILYLILVWLVFYVINKNFIRENMKEKDFFLFVNLYILLLILIAIVYNLFPVFENNDWVLFLNEYLSLKK
jgi:magnesium-transporting ATPase (P-type)